MTSRQRILLTTVAIMTAATITLAALFRPLGETTGIHLPGPIEARRAEAMFVRLLDDGQGGDPAAFGLASQRLENSGREGIALSEPAEGCSGRGVYLVRRGKGLIPVAVTAPHRGSDIHTGTIASQLYGENPFAAAAWNSAPRRAGGTCPHAIDVTREPRHYFTSFAKACARRFPRGRIVQLHGFEHAKRSSMAAQNAGIVLSDGSESPSERLLDLADCLNHAFPRLAIAVYPIDTRELGATQNAQGRALRAAGFEGFTHVEMAPSFRQRLIERRTTRDAFAACLAHGVA